MCVGAKNDSFGVFKSPLNATVKSFQLVHISGGVAWEGGAEFEGAWGDHESEKFEIHVTNTKNERIAPPANYPLDDVQKLQYSLPGQSYNGSQLIFPDFVPRLLVQKGQVFRIWYGEDLANYDEENNSGRTCADVYMEFMADN